jgi:hypothetical protein
MQLLLPSENKAQATAEEQWDQRKDKTKQRHKKATASTSFLNKKPAASCSLPLLSPTFGGDGEVTIVTKCLFSIRPFGQIPACE